MNNPAKTHPCSPAVKALPAAHMAFMSKEGVAMLWCTYNNDNIMNKEPNKVYKKKRMVTLDKCSPCPHFKIKKKMGIKAHS